MTELNSTVSKGGGELEAPACFNEDLELTGVMWWLSLISFREVLDATGLIGWLFGVLLPELWEIFESISKNNNPEMMEPVDSVGGPYKNTGGDSNLIERVTDDEAELFPLVELCPEWRWWFDLWLGDSCGESLEKPDGLDRDSDLPACNTRERIAIVRCFQAYTLL